MKRNLLLFLAVLLGMMLVVNGTKRIFSFRTTSQKVDEAEARLNKLRKEHEALKRELEYKKSQEFQEGEIRNKLGLAKEGETIVVLPKEDNAQSQDAKTQKDLPNWKKWKRLLLST